MSDFMKDIIEQASTMDVPEQENELDIISRTASEPVKETVEKPVVIKPKKHKKKSEITEKVLPKVETLGEAQIVIEQLSNNITRLEEQVSKVVELVEAGGKKYPFAEGATATNHSTGKQYQNHVKLRFMTRN